MEGLIFFIAIIVFIARILGKFKKGISSPGKGKKPSAPSLLKDKLEELISNMEKAGENESNGVPPAQEKEYYAESYVSGKTGTEEYGAVEINSAAEAESLPVGIKTVTETKKIPDKTPVLFSLSKYSELQKAVIYKEIIDSPAFEKY